MKTVREVGAAASALRRLLASREPQLVSGERLRRLLRKLEAIGKEEKASRCRVVKLVAEISEAVCEEYLRK